MRRATIAVLGAVDRVTMKVGMVTGLDMQRGELYCPTCEQTFARGERCPADNTRLVKIASEADRLIGRELDGRYTIVEPIGHGGMGTVYRATQHSVGREVAIKVVMPSLVANPIVIKRFLREAKLASRLAHPNAVSVLDFGQTDDGLFYLVMELVSGRTLDRVIAVEGALPPLRVVRIGAQICDALEGAHALDIVHRDLKPQNVMVMTTGRDLVKVLDFGLAKSLTPDASSATMTNAGALLGTPAFMPPELVTGGHCDARADLYSLGCVLYVAATGRMPFVAGSVHELIAMHATEPVPPIVGWPRRLVAVIERLLAKQPDQRYPSAAAARDALEGALVTEPPRAGPAVDEPLHSATPTVLGWINTPPPGRVSAALPSARGEAPARAGSSTRLHTPSQGVVPPSRAQTPTAGGPRAAPRGPMQTPNGTLVQTPGIAAPRPGSPSGPAPVPAPSPPAPATARRTAPFVIAGLLVILIGAVAAFAVMNRNAQPDPPPTTPNAGSATSR